jgi:SAM-dependent methyltransferase
MSDYSKIKLTPEQVEAEEYKKHLGGGAEKWEMRGAFQVELLKELGLGPEHTLLDIGCGPLRGGMHFIKYLNTGNYVGVDFNRSFIEAGHLQLKRAGFSSVVNQVAVINDFNFSGLNNKFDYLLCFSVLNHCSESERRLFFNHIGGIMQKNSRLVITHGGWFKQSRYECLSLRLLNAFRRSFKCNPRGNPGFPLKLQKTLRTETDIQQGFKFQQWGFEEGTGDMLPILVFGLNQ